MEAQVARRVGLILLSLSLAACGGQPTRPAVPEPALLASHPLWPDIDLAVERAWLQGRWSLSIGRGRHRQTAWAIEGDTVTITKGDSKAETGLLVLDSPGLVGVKTGEVTSYYAYARNRQKTWLGLGRGGVKTARRAYIYELHGLVVVDGDRCTYHPRRLFVGPPEFQDPIELLCELQERDGQTELHYQMPDLMTGELEARSVEVRGGALLDRVLADHELVRMD